MSAFGMHPTFGDKASYLEWRASWRRLQKNLTRKIRKEKAATKELQRTNPEAARKAQKNLHYTRVMGHKLMTLLKDGKERMARITAMQQQIAEQNASFPIDLGKCPLVDFHFNRGYNQFPSILPMWILKAKGKSYYLNHIDFHNVSFSTRELAEGSTKGMLRFRHVYLEIDSEGTAILRSLAEKKDLAA